MSRALDKGLSLLGHVADGNDTLPELVRTSGLPKSTVHRLASVLIDQGLLRYRDNRYVLGYRLLELSEKARRNLDYLSVARPHLRDTSNETLETVHLGELSDGYIVYLEKIPGQRGLQMSSRIGLRVPAQTTALGKVLIAYRPRSEWSRHLLDIPPRTPQSKTDEQALLAELEEVRRTGYALDREENEPGTRCVAAPIWDDRGQVFAAISVSGAAIYITEERQRELLPVVIDCAHRISKDLGGGEAPLDHSAVQD